MALGYIKGANGNPIEIVDIFARNKIKELTTIKLIPSAVIPVVNGQIDYTVGETEIYIVSTSVNTGTYQPYEIITDDIVDYGRGGGFYPSYLIPNGYVSDSLWSYPEVQNASTYPHIHCKKLDTENVFDSWYNEKGLSGTRKINITSSGNTVIYDGTNGDTANCWILNRVSSVDEYLNGFPPVEEASDDIKKAVRLSMKDSLGVYNVLDYGINTENEDNTLALQTLVNSIEKVGGGTIFFPIGTYLFDTASENISNTFAGTGATKCCVKAKSHVSIIGENLTQTVLKLVGNSPKGVAMFGFKDAENPLTGCLYSNFTIDASETSIDTYSSDGKAFFYKYVKDCIFRDLRLIGTPATAMGNDFLDNVVMDSIYVYNAGRIHADNSTGGAGIGIGTGGFENENFIVRNCICDSCGHFGIFCEDQALFDVGTPKLRNPKGMIIANNIVRNGRNYGIGLRGGKYATVVGNNVYSNANGGIYLDFGVDSSAIMNNLISDETNAICFGNETDYYACNNIAVTGNTIIGCANDIVKTKEPTNTVIQNNIVI